MSDPNGSGGPTPTGPPDPSGPGHSDIFERLVRHETDIVGLIAYGFYQQRKRDWIQSYRSKNGRWPDQQQRDEFSFGFRDKALGDLRSNAEGAMFRFAEEIVAQRTQELRRNALAAETRETLSEIERKLTKLDTYKHHIFGHLLGFGALILIAAVFALGVKFEPSIEKFWHWFMGLL